MFSDPGAADPCARDVPSRAARDVLSRAADDLAGCAPDPGDEPTQAALEEALVAADALLRRWAR